MVFKLWVTLVCVSSGLKSWARSWRVRRLTRAVAASRRLGTPTELAHVVRHLGDAYRDVGRPAEAEPCYREALTLYRNDPTTRPLDLANAIRGYALLEDAADELEESRRLWEEAYGLYVAVHVTAGVAESAARLALLARRQDEADRCRDWLSKALAAARASADPETSEYVAVVESTVGGWLSSRT